MVAQGSTEPSGKATATAWVKVIAATGSSRALGGTGEAEGAAKEKGRLWCAGRGRRGLRLGVIRTRTGRARWADLAVLGRLLEGRHGRCGCGLGAEVVARVCIGQATGREDEAQAVGW